MRTPPKQDFATILHLAEMYCEQGAKGTGTCLI